MTRFIVWGRIAGEPVPEANLGPLTVTDSVPPWLDNLKDETGIMGLRATPENVASSASAMSSEIVARSTHYFFVRLHGEDPVSTAKRALREHVTPFIAALIATTGESYFAQAVWSTEVNKQGAHVRSVQLPMESAITIQFPAVPPLQEVGDLLQTVTTIHDDANAHSAATYLVEGTRMYSKASTDSGHEAALLRLHLAIETLARTAYVPKSDPSLETRQQPIVDQLRQTLARAGTTSQAAKVIKNANTNLERERLAFVRDQIKHLGATLGLSDEIVAAALEVAMFRNKFLGHSSSNRLSISEWRDWEGKALRTASAYLAAYCIQGTDRQGASGQ